MKGETGKISALAVLAVSLLLGVCVCGSQAYAEPLAHSSSALSSRHGHKDAYVPTRTAVGALREKGGAAEEGRQGESRQQRSSSQSLSDWRSSSLKGVLKSSGPKLLLAASLIGAAMSMFVGGSNLKDGADAELLPAAETSVAGLSSNNALFSNKVLLGLIALGFLASALAKPTHDGGKRNQGWRWQWVDMQVSCPKLESGSTKGCIMALGEGGPTGYLWTDDKGQGVKHRIMFPAEVDQKYLDDGSYGSVAVEARTRATKAWQRRRYEAFVTTMPIRVPVPPGVDELPMKTKYPPK